MEKYISKFMKPKEEIPHLLKNQLLVIDNPTKAEMFAEHFSKIFNKENPTRQQSIAFSKNQISDIQFSMIEILQMLKTLPDKDGTSPDNISYRFLKKCHQSIAVELTDMFRISLDSGKLPKIWKKSIIIPIFKKGDRTNINNYRPISLTCSTCRVFERIIAKNITEFLLKYNLLSEHQFGFIQKRSTNTQLITTLEDWFDAITEKRT